VEVYLRKIPAECIPVFVRQDDAKDQAEKSRDAKKFLLFILFLFRIQGKNFPHPVQDQKKIAG